MSETRSAIVVGAGIGGLVCALALQKSGWSVTVLERASTLQEVGAGIQLSPNAMKVMQTLGLADDLLKAGFQPEALEMRLGTSGREVFSVPLNERQLDRWGAPYLHIHRAHLLEILLEAVEGSVRGTVLPDEEVKSVSADRKRTNVATARGSRFQADLVVGADGIHSVVAGHVGRPPPPTFTGNVAWRATVETARLGDDAPPPTACVWTGAGRHAVTYRLDGGRLCNFVGVVEQKKWTAETWSIPGRAEDALQDFAGFDRRVTRLIELADPVFKWGLFEHAPMNRWHKDHVVLLGDACHAMLPFMAQGAAMAIEDAFVLARELADQTSVSKALSRYCEIRRGRTAAMQKASRENGHLFHRAGGLSRLLSYGPAWLAGRIDPGLIARRQDWIYRHDPRTDQQQKQTSHA